MLVYFIHAGCCCCSFCSAVCWLSEWVQGNSCFQGSFCKHCSSFIVFIKSTFFFYKSQIFRSYLNNKLSLIIINLWGPSHVMFKQDFRKMFSKSSPRDWYRIPTYLQLIAMSRWVIYLSQLNRKYCLICLFNCPKMYSPTLEVTQAANRKVLTDRSNVIP